MISQKKIFYKISFLLMLFFLASILQLEGNVSKENPKSAEQMLKEMSLEEKIGQLFIIGVYSNPGDAKQELQHANTIEMAEDLIKNYHVGGVLLKWRWEPLRQIHYINYLQSQSSIPLLVTQDCEWGLGMRHASISSFPKNMTLGAIQDNALLYQLGELIGEQCRQAGVDLNLAPVVDVNSNPANPVIGKRSFGDDPVNVAFKSSSFALGMEKKYTLACAKHFPGHGDTFADSHFDLPTIHRNLEQLEKVDLFPFKHIIESGIQFVMIANIVVPALDPTKNLPATLSPIIITEVLRKKMGFKGFVISDDLMMGAISNHFEPDEAVFLAYKAGNDFLLSSKNVPEGVARLKKGFETGELSMQELDERVLRILQLKQEIANRKETAIPMLTEDSLGEDLENEALLAFREQLYGAAMTVVQDPLHLLPFKPEAKQDATFVQIGGEIKSDFYQKLNAQYGIKRFFLGADASINEAKQTFEKVKNFKKVIVALYPSPGSLRGVGVPNQGTLSFMEALNGNKSTQVIFVSFENAYLLKSLPIQNMTVLQAYEDEAAAQKMAFEVFRGALKPTGILPIKL